MKLDSKQIAELIQLTVSTKADSLGCDDCYELMDQFAQAELDGKSVPESLKVVEEHMTQCKCCRDEYSALMTALREIESYPKV
jgi:uncharacterized protein with PIN domain